MQTNDVELIRVYTREPGRVVSDITAEPGEDFEVVLEAEAGERTHTTGGAYEVSIVVLDLTVCNIMYGDSLTGFFGDTNWPDLRTQVVFTIPAAQITPALDKHIMQVEAVLLTGMPGAPYASFCTSPKFIIYKRKTVNNGHFVSD
jgi:hypothetical protein